MPSGPCPIAVAARTKSRLHIDRAAPRDQHCGEGEDEVGRARQRLVDPAAARRRPGAQGDAGRHADADGDQANRDRGLRPHHDARKHVAAEMVGAQRIGGRGRHQLGAHLQLVDSMRRPDDRDQRRADEQQQQHGADLEADMAGRARKKTRHVRTRGRGSRKA
jgi:hypothetical protein